MYGKYKKYRRYNYHNYNQNSVLDDLFDAFILIIVKLGYLMGKLILKLFNLIKSKLRKQSEAVNVEINKIGSISEREMQFSQIPSKEQRGINQKYSLKSSLITPAENQFLDVLERIVGSRYHIECQVQMSRLVNVSDSNEYYTNYRDFNKIKAKSIDFVLFDEKYKPHLAIELDDHTHSRLDRIRRDLFVDEVMREVGLPIIHVSVAYPNQYNVGKLKEQMLQISDLDLI